MRRYFSLIYLYLLLAGCVSLSPTKLETVDNFAPDKLMLSTNIPFNLLPPITFGQEIIFTQIAKIQAMGKSYELIFQLEISNNKMTVVALLPTGIKLFTIVYDGNTIQSHGNADALNNIQPKYLLADIQLSLWPLDVLNDLWFNQLTCYKNLKCQFLVSLNKDQRRLVFENDDIVTIEIESSEQTRIRSVYFHHQRNYRIELQTIELKIINIETNTHDH